MSEKENKSSFPVIGCLIFLVIFLIISCLISVNSLNEPAKTENKPACPSITELEQAINEYKNAKVITKIEPKLNTVYISQLAQNRLQYEDMETLGYICACYSSQIKGSGLVWVNINSSKDHKKIAKYSESYGFKMY